MRLSKVLGLITCVAVLSAPLAHAEVYCNETVTSVIVAGDTVYFTTNETCPNWCEVNTSWDATATGRAMALLTTARTSPSLTIEFAWSQISSCGTAAPTYSSPDFVIL